LSNKAPPSGLEPETL